MVAHLRGNGQNKRLRKWMTSYFINWLDPSPPLALKCHWPTVQLAPPQGCLNLDNSDVLNGAHLLWCSPLTKLAASGEKKWMRTAPLKSFGFYFWSQGEVGSLCALSAENKTQTHHHLKLFEGAHYRFVGQEVVSLNTYTGGINTSVEPHSPSGICEASPVQ